MPFCALTAPPCGPVVGMVAPELGLEGDGVAVACCSVALAPSTTLTWPAGTAELAAAVTLNSEAILLALAEVPLPYRTWVVVSGLLAFPIFPAR